MGERGRRHSGTWPTSLFLGFGFGTDLGDLEKISSFFGGGLVVTVARIIFEQSNSPPFPVCRFPPAPPAGFCWTVR
jgi:hypothetical protein